MKAGFEIQTLLPDVANGTGMPKREDGVPHEGEYLVSAPMGAISSSQQLDFRRGGNIPGRNKSGGAIAKAVQFSYHRGLCACIG